MEDQEIVFEIGGEGGGIEIIRVRSKSGEKFIYYHNEFDPTEEGNGVNFKNEYSSFEEPFQLLISRYEWYRLQILTVHEDYRQYVIEELVRSLNDKSVSLNEHYEYTISKFEHSLKIKLNFSRNDDTKKVNWSYSEADIN
jgi:hypothetical protein